MKKMASQLKLGPYSASMKSSPGLILILVGFMTIYFIVGFKGGGSEASITTYLGIGFGFFVTVSGIILLFRDLGRGDIGTSSLESSLSSSDIELAVSQLGKNYDILRRQATQGFILAGVFMAMGILVILAGSIGEMFGFTKTAGNLTTIAGVVIEAVSGMGLYLFKETFKRLNTISDRLHEMWKILAAFKKVESLPEEKRADIVATLIYKLVEIQPTNG